MSLSEKKQFGLEKHVTERAASRDISKKIKYFQIYSSDFLVSFPVAGFRIGNLNINQGRNRLKRAKEKQDMVFCCV